MLVVNVLSRFTPVDAEGMGDLLKRCWDSQTVKRTLQLNLFHFPSDVSHM